MNGHRLPLAAGRSLVALMGVRLAVCSLCRGARTHSSIGHCAGQVLPGTLWLLTNRAGRLESLESTEAPSGQGEGHQIPTGGRAIAQMAEPASLETPGRSGVKPGPTVKSG